MFTQHIILPCGAADAMTFWVLHTHAFSATDYSPHVLLISAVKRSGKSTVLRVLNELCARSLAVEHCSSAALFRGVEKFQPTLLLDEGDTYIKADDQLRGLLNSSFQRGGKVLRVEGEQREARFFPTFTPTAIAAIGDLPGTIMDRAIIIRMKRKTASETVNRFRKPAHAACSLLKRKLCRWAADYKDKLAAIAVQMPESLNDREQDFWEPLFQIAVKLGPEWKTRAYEAAVRLQQVEAADVLATDRNSSSIFAGFYTTTDLPK